MTNALRSDQEDAIRQRDELRDELDQHRAKSMIRKSSIKKSITSESLKRSHSRDPNVDYSGRGSSVEGLLDENGIVVEGSFDVDGNDQDASLPQNTRG